MTIVVDASIALKWVSEKPGSDAAEELRERTSSALAMVARRRKCPVATHGSWGTNGRRSRRAGDRTRQSAGRDRAAGAGPRRDDAPRSPAQSPGLRLPLPALAKRLGTFVVTADTRFGPAAVHLGTHVGHFRVLSQMIRGTGHECSVLTRNASQGGESRPAKHCRSPAGSRTRSGRGHSGRSLWSSACHSQRLSLAHFVFRL